MLHQDKERHSSSRRDHQAPAAYNHQSLQAALDWLLAGIVLGGIRFRNDCTWSPINLIRVALLWVWSEEKTLGDRFSQARKIVRRAWSGVGQPASSYQAFTKLLCRWTAPLLWAVVTLLRQRMHEELRERFTIAGFVVFAVDGSRMELARTRSLEERFSPRGKKRSKRKSKKGSRKGRRAPRRRPAAANDKKANSPQMWLTTLWHVGSGLPWDWRSGPSDSSERQHLLEMIASLPSDSLVTADAGFVGYEYWKALIESGRHFVIRVGANVKLLRKLGYAREKNGVVYLWPDKAASKQLPPLVLRLIKVRTGRHPMYLVTSILEEKVLSAAALVEIYAKRWGIELFYRNFKQTFERRKLRSHAADNAQLEADWSVVGLWAMLLYGQYELAKQGIPPDRVSTAGVLRAFRKSMGEYKSCPDPGESFTELLAVAIIDVYQRASKASRNYPRKKHGQAIGAPIIIVASAQQRCNARRIQAEMQKGLTA